MIELYDMGRTTHRAVKGMYEFIINNIDRYVSDQGLAERLKEEAKNREVKGHSIPQEYFSAMCNVWTQAYRTGDFPIDLQVTIFPDTIPRFQRVKANGRNIGILTSASRDVTDILYGPPIGENARLSDLVDNYFLGEEIGDKDFPDTFAGLWERTKGGIYAVFDDKPSVCKAASDGIKLADGSARVYLVDRKNQYSGDAMGELTEKSVIKISSFDEVKE
jgi:methionine salvage enolase-phosphatase E1